MFLRHGVLLFSVEHLGAESGPLPVAAAIAFGVCSLRPCGPEGAQTSLALYAPPQTALACEFSRPAIQVALEPVAL